jgi:hypothetical protein
MLEFETEELSGLLVAYSNNTPFKSYWINEGAWIGLRVVNGDAAGPNIGKEIIFNTLDGAIQEANNIEAEMDVHETH